MYSQWQWPEWCHYMLFLTWLILLAPAATWAVLAIGRIIRGHRGESRDD